MKKIIYAILFLGVTLTANGQTETPMENFDSNFAHTVYFWLKEPTNTAHRQKFEASLRTFLNNSAFAKTNYIGTPPKASRDVVDGSFTYALIVTFESAEAQEGYQKEAAHLKFIEECKDLWNKVIVYDSHGIE